MEEEEWEGKVASSLFDMQIERNVGLIGLIPYFLLLECVLRVLILKPFHFSSVAYFVSLVVLYLQKRETIPTLEERLNVFYITLFCLMATSVAKKQSSTPITPNTVGCFSFSKQVLLHNWWLIRADSDSHVKQLGIGGFTFSFKEGQEMRCFCSAPIVKRHDAVTLETAEGITIMVHGYLNKSRTLENGFSHKVCDHFLIGFPYYWEEFAAPSDGEEEANLSDSKGASVLSEEASSGNTSKLPVKCNKTRKQKKMRDVEHTGPLTRSRARKTRTGLVYGNEIRHC